MDKEGQYILAVDFDGTLTMKNAWPEVGELDFDMIEAVKCAQKAGHIIILNTGRTGPDLEEAVDILRICGLEPDRVNENYSEPDNGRAVSDKIYSHFMYDDMSFNWDRYEAKSHLKLLAIGEL